MELTKIGRGAKLEDTEKVINVSAGCQFVLPQSFDIQLLSCLLKYKLNWMKCIKKGEKDMVGKNSIEFVCWNINRIDGST